jgi:hypothetical protein
MIAPMMTKVMMPVTVVRRAACSLAASSTGPASASATFRLSAGEKKIPANAADELGLEHPDDHLGERVVVTVPAGHRRLDKRAVVTTAGGVPLGPNRVTDLTGVHPLTLYGPEP